MKKNDLLKAIGICFIVFVVLSWIIPVGSYATGEYVKGVTAPLGITDLFYYPVITFGTFIQYGLFFLILGGFYGVMNKTGVYKKMVDATVKKFRKHEKLCLVLSISILATLSALTGATLSLFVLVPFLVAIVLSLGYNKIVAFASTVGAILVGGIGSIYGVNNAHVNNMLSLDIHNNLIAKIGLLAVLVFLLIMYVLKRNVKVENKKENKNKEALEIPLLDKNETNKKSFAPLAIILFIIMLLLLVGTYSWNYNIGITFFEDVYTSLSEITIKDYAIVKNLIGSINPFGYWDTYEICFVLVVASLVVGWIYSLKVDDMVSSFSEGCKKMLKVAFFATLANIIFTLMIAASDSSILNTINNWILSMSENFNVGVATLLGLVGGLFYNNFYYLSNITLTAAKTVYLDTTTYGVFGLLFQSIYSLIMLIVPTSFVMVAGLSMLDISFKDWFKYIWKYLFQAFIIILIVAIIVFMLI